MHSGAHHFWVALPPGTEDLSLLRASQGLAEPVIDLRYGSTDEGRVLVGRAVEAGLRGLTIFVDARQADLLAWLPEGLRPGSRVILSMSSFRAREAAVLVEALRRPGFAGSSSSGGVAVGFEVDDRTTRDEALAAGADFLVASGNEAAGPVSPKTTLILLQELLPGLNRPLVVRGSLGPLGAAAALAAGCAGCILDTQLLLAPESPLIDAVKDELKQVSPLDTAMVGSLLGRPYRFLARGGQDAYARLAAAEKRAFLQAGPEGEAGVAPVACQPVRHVAPPPLGALEAHPGAGVPHKQPVPHAPLESLMGRSFRDGAALAPVGQGIAFARGFDGEGLDVRAILRRYEDAWRQSVARVKRAFPFARASALARRHGVDLPVVMGPMAHITDRPAFAARVAEAGALPFVATTGLSPGEIRDLLKRTRKALGDRPFGVGLIAFSPFERAAEQVGAILAERPAFVTVAGGDPPLARSLEEAGIGVYLHAPSPAHVRNFLQQGVRGLILEGHEAGGHVGALGSLVLWELAVQEAATLGARASSLRMLLAGGIATARGALAAAVVASPLVELGAAVGLQLGTAYLMTEEAVASGAIPARYREMLLTGRDTCVLGQTVHLPARWLATPEARRMAAEELTWEAEGLPLAERKHRVEQLNIDHLRAAVKEDAGGLAAEKGAYLCSQAVALVSKGTSSETAGGPLTIAELHEEVTAAAHALAEACPLPAEPADIPDDAVAIVGIGCIFPGAGDAQEYWRNILDRASAIREVPADRWDVARYYDPDPKVRDKSSSKLGSFVEGFEKDPVKFRIPPVSAASIDWIQFLALTVAHQALGDAGYLERDFPRERTAVMLGNSSGGMLALQYCLRANSGEFVDALERLEVLRGLPADLRQTILAQAEAAFRDRFPAFTEDSCPGVLRSVIAGRIGHCFDLGGPAFTMDGACASSMAALGVAVEGLRAGQYDMALVGGIDTRVQPDTYVLFSNLGALSDKGSFPFDERADGFVLGEGAGMVVLKRWADARRDGDRVYAIVRGIGCSGDGRAKGITAPDVKGQVRALERAYEGLPFSPGSVSLIEAHGTGTPVGDLVEVTSLSEFFGRYVGRKRSIGLGSVKSQIGHLKAAAGIAGLIKAALALHHQVLPPTINCERPRNDVDWARSPFYLVTEPRPWEATDGPRRVGVDAFGFGGINYHVVLEEAPGGVAPVAGQPVLAGETHGLQATRATQPELLVFRAVTRDALLESVAAAENALREAEESASSDADAAGGSHPSMPTPRGAQAGRELLRDLALDLDGRPRPQGPALAIVAGTVPETLALIERARRVLADPQRTDYTSAQGIYFAERPLARGEKVAFLYPGQGSQYVGMVGDLAAAFPFVREMLEEIEAVVMRVSGQSVLHTILCEEGLADDERRRRADLLLRTDFNHPALLAMGAVIGRCLERAGLRPDMAAGHSLGEYTALYAAGVFDLATAIALVTARGSRLHQHAFQQGGMATVSAPAAQVEAVLAGAQAAEGRHGFITVANRNCPAQTVISGDVPAVERAMAHFQGMGLRCERLPVASAFHTPLMSSCVEPFRQFLEKVEARQPRIAVQSNLRGAAYEAGGDFPRHLRDALAAHMVNPVEFIRNVESMYEAGARVFLEVGPGSTLSSFVDSVLADRPHWTFPTNVPRRPAALQLVHALGFCAARGLPVNLAGLGLRRRGQAGLAAAPARPSVRRQELKLPPGKTGGETAYAGTADLVREALADQDPATVDRYLRQRADFIRSMVRLDFQHAAENVAHPPSGVMHAPPGAAAPRGVAGPALPDGLQQKVVDLVARRTGYPPDVIDLDLDVEAELGLDSIKQVEIVNELEKSLGVDLRDGAQTRRYHITTLRDLIDRLRGLTAAAPPPPPANTPSPLQGGGEDVAPAAGQPVQTGERHGLPATDATQPMERAPSEGEYNTDCRRWVSELVEKPIEGPALPDALRGKQVLLLTGKEGRTAESAEGAENRHQGSAKSALGDLGDQSQEEGPGGLLAEQLRALGAEVRTHAVDDGAEDLPANVDVVVNLSSLAEEGPPDLAHCADWWARTARRTSALLKAAQHVVRCLRNASAPKAPGGRGGAGDADGPPLPGAVVIGRTRRVLWVEVSALGGDFGAHQYLQSQISNLRFAPSARADDDGRRKGTAGAGVGLALSRCLHSELAGQADDDGPRKGFEVLYLDFEPGLAWSAVTSAVVDELSHVRRHAEVGYAQGRRFEVRWRREPAEAGVGGTGCLQTVEPVRPAPVGKQPVPHAEAARGFRLDAESVVLAVGGARGITAAICRRIAQRTRARFVIVGRSTAPAGWTEAPAPYRGEGGGEGGDRSGSSNRTPRPSLTTEGAEAARVPSFAEAREAVLAEERGRGRRVVPAEIDAKAWQRVWAAERACNLAALRSSAGAVVYRQCDVTEPQAVDRLVREVWGTFGRIDLVLQGSGDLVDKSVEDLTPAEFIEGMKPKALGTACLLAALAPLKVGAFVNLSSIAGRWGNMGQSAYAAGHEVAAGLVAAARRQRPGRWINVFYGPWLDVGMVRIGAIMERLREKGTHFVTEAAGSDFVMTEFELGSSHNVAFCGDEPVAVVKGWAPAPERARPSTPLLDDVLQVGPGCAEARRLCDPARDRFIAEHVIAHEPILPGVVALEMMAQTASLVAGAIGGGGKGGHHSNGVPLSASLTDVEDLALVRAVRFPRGEPREVRIRARLLSAEDGSVWCAAELFTLFQPPGSATPEETVHARSRLRFGVRQEPPPPSLVVVETGLGERRVDAAPLWETRALKARVGAFRNVRAVVSLTREAIVAEVLGNRLPGLGHPPLTDNPIRLDGTVFFVDFLTALRQGNSSHYVDAVDRITFFGSGDVEGARVCRCRLVATTDTTITCDLEAVDAMGRVRERLTGVHKVASLPGDAAELAEPVWAALRENAQCGEVARLLGHPGRLALAHVRIPLVAAALERGGEEALVREHCAEDEMGAFRRLSHPKRRREWLAGRLAAKGAVRMLLGAASPGPTAVRIVTLPGRAPAAVVEGVPDPPRISIAHSHEMAVAGAVGRGRLGVDVEELSLSVADAANRFTTPEEVDRLAAEAGVAQVPALMSLWAAKEAVLKAVGPETCSMSELRLERARADGVYVACNFVHPSAGRIQCVTFQGGSYFYAVSLAPERAP